MRTVAVRIPDEWKERMARFPIRWSDVLREAIEERLQQLERELVLREFVRSGPAPRAVRGTARKSIRGDRDGR